MYQTIYVLTFILEDLQGVICSWSSTSVRCPTDKSLTDLTKPTMPWFRFSRLLVFLTHKGTCL